MAIFNSKHQNDSVRAILVHCCIVILTDAGKSNPKRVFLAHGVD
jgi:hypothetical protein